MNARGTDNNQLRRTRRLGSATLPPLALQLFVGALAEIGGFAILLYGFLRSI